MVDTFSNMLFPSTLKIEGETYHFSSLPQAFKQTKTAGKELPFSLKILLENTLRHHEKEASEALISWAETGHSEKEIPFSPARILMQDFTGVPAVVDFAALRDGMKKLGKAPENINPAIPVDLVIDHSLSVEFSGTQEALKKNIEVEFSQNEERYRFLDWAQKNLKNFRVIPPGNGICHQVNLEYIAPLVQNRNHTLFPDTLFGTDSHTTMINGLGVLGWGVGGIEAEAASLGESIAMRIPDVIGVRLIGKLPVGTTSTDLVLTVTQKLRQKGVVGKFVEFFGSALETLPVENRATIANMAPEYGATCGFFPADALTLKYLRLTGRSEKHLKIAETYLKEQKLFRESNSAEPHFTDILEIDLSNIAPCLAGPKNPSERHPLAEVAQSLPPSDETVKATLKNGETLKNNDVVIAAITSCTNTSNPSVMVAAGLLARKARSFGLSIRASVKTSLTPGSRAVSNYLAAGGLNKDLDALGFEVVGYGCATCIGNSGPLQTDITEAIQKNNLTVGAILSGNRNFEGRISPLTKVNYLASPPLVVAYALAGNLKTDLTKDPIGQDQNGKDVYLKDIWPSEKEISDYILSYITPKTFSESYKEAENGTPLWQSLKSEKSTPLFQWPDNSTYLHNPPWVHTLQKIDHFEPISQARILALLGDNITTDHISPAGNISPNSPAAAYLTQRGVKAENFNSYGSRRGNDEIMARGTFANIRIRNEMLPESEGGISRHYPDGKKGSIFDVAMRYKEEKIPLIVIAGENYGMGSSRDWAAKGPNLLGVKAILAESFERIHRSNLVGMGILPLTFPEKITRKSLNLTGEELIDIHLPSTLAPHAEIPVIFTRKNGKKEKILMMARLETEAEIHYLQHGGILPSILQRLASETSQ
ncbi:aconitate hydratase AcnA [Acetobacteraceae bacterium]|nr:aconitate hydratase AcnA [Acetobacteraceae bacterium]